jgi:antitoxin (DNA-binding transcriptional repressor) of toxin-antitoxin stability system
VHNTQPWRFAVTEQAIDLYADVGRQLMEDLAGREMIISGGAALFGLRLAIRSLGYQPEVDLFPEPGQRRLLARVRAGRPAALTSDERAMLRAVPHRHTHRGPFEPGPLPGGLLERLRDDATAEGATLAVIDGPAYQRLTAILTAWSRWRDLYPTSPAEIRIRAETLRWTREAGGQARDGVPAHAFPAAAGSETGRLPQRDFDLARGWGFPPSGGPPAPVTAIMVTPGEDEESWLNAGQALQRILLRAASQWVFARLQTQPLQSASVRAQIRSSLTPSGSPQLLLELGIARASHPTARRPADELATGKLRESR